MTDLDHVLHESLRREASQIPTTSPGALALQLELARDGRRLGRHRRSRLLVAAALVAVVGVLAGVLRLAGSGSTARPAGVSALVDPILAQLGPGWHELDAGPLPAGNVLAMAWTGSDFVVAIRPVTPGGARLGVQTFAFGARGGGWRALPPMPASFVPGSGLGLAWTGTDLVAVSAARGASAAAWNPGTDTWRDIAAPPVAPALLAANGSADVPGKTSREGGPFLVWTGQRVIDLGHGAAWDPVTGAWTLVPFRDNLPSFGYLASTDPVWDGTELVLAAWSPGHGLARDPSGESLRDVPAPPVEWQGPGGGPAAATDLSGRVLVVTSSAGAGSLDARTGVWTREPSLPAGTPPAVPELSAGSDAESGAGQAAVGRFPAVPVCPLQVLTVAGQAVVPPCTTNPGLVLTGAGWAPMAAEPVASPGCCDQHWTAAGDLLLSVETTPAATRLLAWVPG
jgi:hypothetical protein